MIGEKMSYTENILKMLPDRINQRNDLMVTPPWIAKDMINLLPEEVWNKNSTFLDPACKSGIFLHEIYLKLMETESLIKEFPDKAERREHILQNQLFGIALNPMCQLMSTRTVYGTIQGENNIILIDNYINIIKNKDTKFFKEAIKEQFGEMKFNVVIGNPPYNDADTKVATAIYSRFVEDGMGMADKCSAFIIPARWYASGRGLERFRKIMLTEHKIKKLVDYEDEKQIFPNQTIAGGVCYFLADKDDNKICEITSIKKDGSKTIIKRELDKYEIFVRDTDALSIIDKIKLDKGFYSLSMGVQSVDYFNVKDNPYVCTSKESTDMIPIVDASGFLYANREDLNDGYNLIDNYNVIVTHAVGSKDYVLPRTMQILQIGQACSVTYLCIGATKNKENAENLLKYIKTRFVRFLIKQALSGINISAKSFMFVPMQDFKSDSDIDWSQSISNIDQQLYKKYNLTEEEIAYIEKTIKPMQ